MSWKGKTILIAEDEESNFLYLEAVLSKTGVRMLWARNGQEVIDLCQEDTAIDLILMDLQMPILNGYEAREQIKALRPGLPQIAQTAFAMADDEKRAMEAGFDSYISKPIRKNSLISLIEQFIGSPD